MTHTQMPFWVNALLVKILEQPYPETTVGCSEDTVGTPAPVPSPLQRAGQRAATANQTGKLVWKVP